MAGSLCPAAQDKEAGMVLHMSATGGPAQRSALLRGSQCQGVCLAVVSRASARWRGSLRCLNTARQKGGPQSLPGMT